MCGTHEANKYFNQVKHFNNFRIRMDSQSHGNVMFFSVGLLSFWVGYRFTEFTGTRKVRWPKANIDTAKV